MRNFFTGLPHPQRPEPHPKAGHIVSGVNRKSIDFTQPADQSIVETEAAWGVVHHTPVAVVDFADFLEGAHLEIQNGALVEAVGLARGDAEAAANKFHIFAALVAIEKRAALANAREPDLEQFSTLLHAMWQHYPCAKCLYWDTALTVQDFLCDLQVEAGGVSGWARKRKQVTAYFKLGKASANKGATRDMCQASYGVCCPTSDGGGRGLVASVGAAELSRPAGSGGAPSEALSNLEFCRLFHSDEWGAKNEVNVADFNQVHGGNTIDQSKKHRETRSFQAGFPGIYHSNTLIRFQQELDDAQFRRVQVRTCAISVVAKAAYDAKIADGADPASLIVKNPAVKASTHRFVAEHQWLHRCLGCPLNFRRFARQIEAVLPSNLLSTFRVMVDEEVVVCTLTADDVPFPAPAGSAAAKEELARTSAPELRLDAARIVDEFTAAKLQPRGPPPYRARPPSRRLIEEQLGVYARELEQDGRADTQRWRGKIGPLMDALCRKLQSGGPVQNDRVPRGSRGPSLHLS